MFCRECCITCLPEPLLEGWGVEEDTMGFTQHWKDLESPTRRQKLEALGAALIAAVYGSESAMPHA